MKDYILTTQKFHENNYKIFGDDYQRKFPDENVIKFTKAFLKKKSKILDVEAGNARNSIFLINEGHDVDVLDFSGNALNIIKKKNKNYLKIISQIENIRKNNNVNWMNILRIAFKDNSKVTAKVMSKIYSDDKRIGKIVKKLT